MATESLRWIYAEALEDMQLLKGDESDKFAELYGDVSPFEAARAKVHSDHNASEERIRKLPKKVAAK